MAMHDELVEYEHNGRVVLVEGGTAYIVVDETDIFPLWLESWYMTGYGWVIRLSDYKEWLGGL